MKLLLLVSLIALSLSSYAKNIHLNIKTHWTQKEISNNRDMTLEVVPNTDVELPYMDVEDMTIKLKISKTEDNLALIEARITKGDAKGLTSQPKLKAKFGEVATIIIDNEELGRLKLEVVPKI